jgi:hypothetical protein
LAPLELINDPLKRFARLFSKIKKSNLTGMDMVIPGILKNRLAIFEELTSLNYHKTESMIQNNEEML